jgi:hypothetical protein
VSRLSNKESTKSSLHCIASSVTTPPSKHTPLSASPSSGPIWVVPSLRTPCSLAHFAETLPPLPLSGELRPMCLPSSNQTTTYLPLPLSVAQEHVRAAVDHRITTATRECHREAQPSPPPCRAATRVTPAFKELPGRLSSRHGCSCRPPCRT